MTQDEFAAPYRQDDYLFLVNLPTWTDDAGHIGYPGFGEFEGRLYADGELLLEGDNPLWLQGPVPAERHEYRLVETTHRQNGFWQRSTTTESVWTFSSARPESGLETLPLMVVDYDLPLTSTSTAPAGTAFSFDVHFGMPARVEVASMTKVRVEISWDGGATWADATLRNCSLGKPGQGGVASLAAAAFQHQAVTEKVRRDGADPVQELLLVALRQLRVTRPLVTECLGSSRFDFANHFGEARDATADRVILAAAHAAQPTLHDLLALPRADSEREVVLTGRTGQQIEQRWLHELFLVAPEHVRALAL